MVSGVRLGQVARAGRGKAVVRLVQQLENVGAGQRSVYQVAWADGPRAEVMWSQVARAGGTRVGFR